MCVFVCVCATFVDVVYMDTLLADLSKYFPQVATLYKITVLIEMLDKLDEIIQSTDMVEIL